MQFKRESCTRAFRNETGRGYSSVPERPCFALRYSPRFANQLGFQLSGVGVSYLRVPNTWVLSLSLALEAKNNERMEVISLQCANCADCRERRLFTFPCRMCIRGRVVRAARNRSLSLSPFRSAPLWKVQELVSRIGRLPCGTRSHGNTEIEIER